MFTMIYLHYNYKKYNDKLDYLNYSIKDRLKFYLKIPLSSKLIPVESCFNGIGIYKYKFIKNLYYDGNKKLCEHVF